MSKMTYTVSTPKRLRHSRIQLTLYNWVKEVTAGVALHLREMAIAATNCGLLQSREMVLVTITPGFQQRNMTLNDKFIVEVKPPIGAALPIGRTVPGGMVADQVYEVF